MFRDDDLTQNSANEYELEAETATLTQSQITTQEVMALDDEDDDQADGNASEVEEETVGLRKKASPNSNSTGSVVKYKKRRDRSLGAVVKNGTETAIMKVVLRDVKKLLLKHQPLLARDFVVSFGERRVKEECAAANYTDWGVISDAQRRKVFTSVVLGVYRLTWGSLSKPWALLCKILQGTHVMQP